MSRQRLAGLSISNPRGNRLPVTLIVQSGDHQTDMAKFMPGDGWHNIYFEFDRETGRFSIHPVEVVDGERRSRGMR